MRIFTINIAMLPNVRLIGHVNYTTPWKHFTRTIDEYIMYIVERGELYITEGTNDYCLKKGDSLILEPNIIHTGFKESCCNYYYIHFNIPGLLNPTDKSLNEVAAEMNRKRALSLSENNYLNKLPYDPIIYLPKHFDFEGESELLSILVEANYDFHQKYENYKAITSLRFLELIIKMSRIYATKILQESNPHFSKSFLRIHELIDHINTHYSENITCEVIEELFESNYDYLNRVFKRAFGYTIMNYITHLRITKAKDLICTTSISFSEIGYLVGINDQYYFSKLFKKHTGMSPSQYAKNRYNVD